MLQINKLKQPAGAPFIISETNWVPPISFQAEGPFLVSLFQSLNGVDGFYWFQSKDIQWRPPSSSNGFLPSLAKWVVQSPMIVGQFPAAAMAYRQYLIAPGEVTLRVYRPLQAMFEREPPAVVERQGFDPNRDKDLHSNKDGPDTKALVAGRVELQFTNPTKAEKEAPITYTERGFWTTNKQIRWDVQSGIVALDAPAAQGGCGFFYGAKIKTQHLSLTVQNPYACIMVVEMDGMPLDQSEKIFMQFGTRQFSTGWQTKAVTWQDKKAQKTYSGREIEQYGEAPWQVEELFGEVTIKNNKIKSLLILDGNGMTKSIVDLTAGEQGYRFELPNASLYGILQ